MIVCLFKAFCGSPVYFTTEYYLQNPREKHKTKRKWIRCELGILVHSLSKLYLKKFGLGGICMRFLANKFLMQLFTKKLHSHPRPLAI